MSEVKWNKEDEEKEPQPTRKHFDSAFGDTGEFHRARVEFSYEQYVGFCAENGIAPRWGEDEWKKLCGQDN